jgi:tRNA (guanine-N7-)-methyltransferase
MKARYLSLRPLVNWRREPHPIPWKNIFGNDNPLVVEIGFGNGEYLVRHAKECPEINFVGIDREWQSVWRALRSIHKCQIPNVRILKADVRWVFTRLFPPESIMETYSLFPCPWPKERHERYRLFSRKFLRQLNVCLAREGVVNIVTDSYPYLCWIREQSVDTGFSLSYEITGPGFSTKYENKWLQAGANAFYRIELKKTCHSEARDAEEPPTEDEKPRSQLIPRFAGFGVTRVDTVTMKTYRVITFDPEQFRPDPLRGDIVVEFKDFLYDSLRKRAMVRALVIEDDFVQDFWVEIKHSGNDWHIRPGEGCGWIPTVGVQKAIDQVYEACLKTCHSEASQAERGNSEEPTEEIPRFARDDGQETSHFVRVDMTDK